MNHHFVIIISDCIPLMPFHAVDNLIMSSYNDAIKSLQHACMHILLVVSMFASGARTRTTTRVHYACIIYSIIVLFVSPQL